MPWFVLCTILFQCLYTCATDDMQTYTVLLLSKARFRLVIDPSCVSMNGELETTQEFDDELVKKSLCKQPSETRLFKLFRGRLSVIIRGEAENGYR